MNNNYCFFCRNNDYFIKCDSNCGFVLCKDCYHINSGSFKLIYNCGNIIKCRNCFKSFKKNNVSNKDINIINDFKTLCDNRIYCYCCDVVFKKAWFKYHITTIKHLDNSKEKVSTGVTN